MRQAYATQLAIVSGVLIVVVAIIFAAVQIPRLERPSLAAAAPVIPHPIEGFENCVDCHGLTGPVPYPMSHLGWPNESCTQCHVPAVPEEAAPRADDGVTPPPALEVAGDLTPQQQQIDRGSTVYLAECAHCHDPGGTAPVLDRANLAAYETARGLFDYTRTTMPPDAPGRLTDEDYWDVTAYMLAAAEQLPEGPTVGPDTADDIGLAE
jgi:mono/diheme cytochrome c family protein